MWEISITGKQTKIVKLGAWVRILIFAAYYQYALNQVTYFFNAVVFSSAKWNNASPYLLGLL